MNETSDRCRNWGPGRSPRAAARVVVFADRSPSREPGGPNESPRVIQCEPTHPGLELKCA
jgi:hypothetical protein